MPKNKLIIFNFILTISQLYVTRANNIPPAYLCVLLVDAFIIQDITAYRTALFAKYDIQNSVLLFFDNEIEYSTKYILIQLGNGGPLFILNLGKF